MPNIKIPREKIIETALEITAESGIESATAKAIAKRLNCSTMPISWTFDTMENLKHALMIQATNFYNEYMAARKPQATKSEAIALNYIQFAKDYPNIFKLLFMTEQKNNDISKVDIVGDREYAISAIKEVCSVNDEIATAMFANIWVLTHGIATLLVTKTADLTDEQIRKMINDVADGLLLKWKPKKE